MVFVESVIVSPAMAVGGKSRPAVTSGGSGRLESYSIRARIGIPLRLCSSEASLRTKAEGKMTGPDPQAERDIELDAILSTYGFLLEMAFSIICDLHPEGQQEAFRRIETSLLRIIAKSPADAYPTTARSVQVSDEAERQLKIFLARLSSRIRG